RLACLCQHRWKVYLRFHPPRLPGAPPVERGAGPNSGPECCELVGCTILLVSPNGFSGSVRVGRKGRDSGPCISSRWGLWTLLRISSVEGRRGSRSRAPPVGRP